MAIVEDLSRWHCKVHEDLAIVKDLGRGAGKVAEDLAIVEDLEVGEILEIGEVLERRDFRTMGEELEIGELSDRGEVRVMGEDFYVGEGRAIGEHLHVGDEYAREFHSLLGGSRFRLLRFLGGGATPCLSFLRRPDRGAFFGPGPPARPTADMEAVGVASGERF